MNDILAGLDEATIRDLAMTAKGLADNKDTRGGFLKLVKTQNPSLNIPEIDIPDSVNAQLKIERDKVAALENRFIEDDVRRNIEHKRNVIMGKGIAANEVSEVEKLMTERGIVNHETAAEFYLAQRRMATPTPPPGNAYQPMTMPKLDAKPFGGNMRSLGKSLAADTFQKIRSGEIAV